MSVFLQPLQTVTVGSGGASTITFSSIPQTYTDLVLKISARSDSASAGYSPARINFSGDSATNYSSTYLQGYGSSVFTGRYTSLTYLTLDGIARSTITANTFSSADLYIPNYTSANYKSFNWELAGENSSTTVSDLLLNGGLWRSTSAVTSITLTFIGENFVQYSSFSLYGVLRQGI